MENSHKLVILVDCDNTLIDSDRMLDDFKHHLDNEFGPTRSRHYWAVLNDLRSEKGYADYVGALTRCHFDDCSDQYLLEISSFLMHYPYASLLYPHALDVVAYLQDFGTVVIMIDGDPTFQRHKLQQAGIWKAIEGNVLIHRTKDKLLDGLQNRFQAGHYVIIDDQLKFLYAAKKVFRLALTSIYLKHEKFGRVPRSLDELHHIDVQIRNIEDMLTLEPSRFAYSKGLQSKNSPLMGHTSGLYVKDPEKILVCH